MERRHFLSNFWSFSAVAMTPFAYMRSETSKQKYQTMSIVTGPSPSVASNREIKSILESLPCMAQFKSIKGRYMDRGVLLDSKIVDIPGLRFVTHTWTSKSVYEQYLKEIDLPKYRQELRRHGVDFLKLS